MADLNDLRQQDEKSFLESVSGSLDELEIIRQAKLKAYLFRKSIGIPITSVLAIPTLYIDYSLLFVWRSSGDDGGFGLTFALLGLAWWWISQPKRDYAKTYKKIFCRALQDSLAI